jgi:hypothetical protein
MGLLNFLHDKIKKDFEENRYQFFTEHDIHSELFRLSNEYYEHKGESLITTLDSKKIRRVHHEYPTPFRCLMPGFEFILIPEAEYQERRRNTPRFRARRGWIDFVSLNPDYINNIMLNLATGKNYRRLRESLDTYSEYPVLDLALEVVYFHDHSFSISPGRRKNSSRFAEQDYKKVCAVKDYEVAEGVPFAKESALMFFATTEKSTQLKASIASISVRKDVPFLTIGL